MLRRGKLVRERRRQRGQPLPIAEKVLPFHVPPSETLQAAPCDKDAEQVLSREEKALARVIDAWSRLATTELAGQPKRALDELEDAYRAELEAYCAATSGLSESGDAP